MLSKSLRGALGDVVTTGLSVACSRGCVATFALLNERSPTSCDSRVLIPAPLRVCCSWVLTCSRGGSFLDKSSSGPKLESANRDARFLLDNGTITCGQLRSVVHRRWQDKPEEVEAI